MASRILGPGYAGDTIIRLDSALAPTDLHSYTEQFGFSVLNHPNYTETPPFYIDTMPRYVDTAVNAVAWTRTPYVYHTFSMEWLPNEVRFLVDSNVVRRYPDRMIPPGQGWPFDQYFDYATRLPRGPVTLRIGEVALDDIGNQKAFFDAYGDSCSGCWPVEIPSGSGHWYKAAHHRVDYVRVWDVPSDMKIPDFTY